MPNQTFESSLVEPKLTREPGHSKDSLLPKLPAWAAAICILCAIAYPPWLQITNQVQESLGFSWLWVPPPRTAIDDLKKLHRFRESMTQNFPEEIKDIMKLAGVPAGQEQQIAALQMFNDELTKMSADESECQKKN